ncbi:Thiazole synthase [Buchnera aphidicola (Neophyllaphis podocarpi)]|uniref:thiazole synthase n=1 Tax=Buchnera aphidicola TaxID=9 RepID=UPI0031B8389E
MLKIANKFFKSHLFIGTGKFASSSLMVDAIIASETNLITVSIKRLDLKRKNEDNILSSIKNLNINIIPNTSGAKDSIEAVLAAEIAREALKTNWIKLEIHPDSKYLMPDPIETLKAAEKLVKKGFIVLPYCNADPILCKYLEEVGCSAVMPLGSAIGSNKGLLTKDLLRIIIEQSNIPVIIDAGIGAPSHAAEAIEMGASGVLVNTAIAVSNNPKKMAKSFAFAVKSGLLSFDSGLVQKSKYSISSSPLTNFLF